MQKRVLLMIILIALLATGVGLWFGKAGVNQTNADIAGGQAASQRKPLQSMRRYPTPKIIADFLLEDSQGNPFGLNNLKGHWSLLFFGYSNCPDICPTTLSTMAAIYRQLETKLPRAELPLIGFISVDPERDLPEKLGSYVKFFHPAFIAATGEAAQLHALTRQLGLLYTIEEHAPGAMDYKVDHSAGIVIFNPEARLVGLLPAPHNVEQISRDLIELIENNNTHAE